MSKKWVAARNWSRQAALPVAVLSLFVCFSLILWSPSHFVLLSSPGIGEMFEAYHAALNIERFGWQWAGLQDMATNPDPAAHPFLYIHHPNFGLYFSYALRKLGVASLETQNLLSIFGTSVGLIAAYVLVMRFTRSAALSLVCLALLSLDFYFIENWAFNLHRAFSYVSVVGTFYAFVKLSDGDFKKPFHFGAAFLACCTLLGTDYMFYFFSFFAIAFYVSLFGTSWRWRLRGYVALIGIFGAAFAARQLQVILGIGLDIWTRDFLFQVLNRLHLESHFSGDWVRETTEFYSVQAVLNPGFVPPSTWLERSYAFLVGTGEAYFRGILGFAHPTKSISLWGGATLLFAFLVNIATLFRARTVYISFVVASGAMTATLGGMVAAAAFHLADSVILGAVAGSIAAGICVSVCWHLIAGQRNALKELSSAAAATKLGGAFLLSCLLLVSIFPTYFTGWYPAFLLAPLCVAFWLVVLLAPLFELFREHALRWASTLSGFKALSVLAALWAAPISHGDHADALRSIRGMPTASNFTPASIASYTHAFSGFLQPEKAQRLLTTGKVEFSDYFMAFERDRANPLYRQPRYFVFLKDARIFGGDWAFLDEFYAVSEGESYALYEVPNAAQD